MSAAWAEGLGAELFVEAGHEQGLPEVVEDPRVIERFCALVKCGGR